MPGSELFNDLGHLQRGQVFLPPQVGLDWGAAGGQQVVQVHHRVDAGVHEGGEAAVSAADKAEGATRQVGKV